MPEILNCPQCERKLRVPDDLLGHAVKCPTCGVVFTAPATATESAAIPVADVEPQEPREIDQEGRSPPTEASDVPGPAPAREYEAPPWPSRRPGGYLEPHRGTVILVLGILSIVICGLLGPVAWVMGNNDMKEIRAGRMDPAGEGTTNAGRILGIISTVIMLISCCGAAILGLIGALGGAAGHRGF